MDTNTIPGALVAAALVKAQRAFGPALKTHTNPAFKSKYADLSACVEAVVDALNSAGIALVQRNIACESGVCVETVFVHESGEQFSSGPLHVPAAKADPQGYGSALTYARRYSLMAACGIAPEDDDGNAGAKAKPAAAPKPSGVIKPTTGAGESLAPDLRDWLAEVADRMREAWHAGQHEKMLAIYRDPGNIMQGPDGQDEDVYVWSLLQSESAMRRYIKDHPATDQKKAA